MFAARGYDETSMAELAAALGIAAGGVYHYFGGKEAAAAAHLPGAHRAAAPARARRARGPRRPADRLRALVDVWVAHVVEHRDHMLVFQQERHVIEAARSGATSARAASASRSSSTACSPRRGRPRARFADRRVALFALLGMVNHTAQWFRPRGRLSAGEVAAGYAGLLVA